MPFQMTHRAFGAQLLQADWLDVNGTRQPVFYLSPQITPDAPARGGVPVLFPQFSDVGPLPKHGMVRNVPWLADGESAYSLAIAADRYPFWPHACALRLEWSAAADTLQIALTVTNTGTRSFTFTGGLHPYFAVADVQRSELTGLVGLPLHDRYDRAATKQIDNALTWKEQPCERLYAKAPPLQLRDASRTLHLSATGFDQWMVWNPGAEGARALADLPDAQWNRFVCVEPVCVDAPVALAPGESFCGKLEVSIKS